MSDRVNDPPTASATGGQFHRNDGHQRWCQSFAMSPATGKAYPCNCGKDDDAEGERRFTLPINPDPVTARLRAEKR